jgi:hypothetical protein
MNAGIESVEFSHVCIRNVSAGFNVFKILNDSDYLYFTNRYNHC